MEILKFGNRIKTADGREGTVQEDQETNSDEVKVMIDGEETASVLKAQDLEKIADHL
ncbi:hypothetical protein [Arcticibacter sp.]|jgi:hypothetical protein|uniref:hypothetical protein n=1 Tax=Arcticibacter sp. TaxID=1872630 RepID=UPI00388CFBBF